MNRALLLLVLFVASIATTLLLTGCGSTRHALPAYEKPLARTNYQNVRTTAYTHTEADHLEYGNHNALGGTLRAAGPAQAPTTTAVMATSTFPTINVDAPGDDAASGFHHAAAFGPTWQEALARSNGRQTPGRPALPPTPSAAAPPVYNAAPPVYGSAAADWSRWPAGTTFRIVSTGQLYRVDDYGWALSGRNTIDLYQPTRAAMNVWGVRQEPIQILQWGDREESLRRLRNHQGYRHIKRMVLELEGRDRAAAHLE